METETLDWEPPAQRKCDLDLFHTIGEHVAKGDTFDETLAAAIDFAVWLVRCDECVVYVGQGRELVPWVWKYSGDRSVEGSRLAVGDGYAAALAEHRQPIAISHDVGETAKIKDFGAWSADPGETFVSVPLLARFKLLGTINLKHRHPHAYSRREFNLLSSVGRLLGTDLRISQLESENSDLLLQLETRKLVERSKGILQRNLGFTAEEAYHALERQSRQKGRPIKEIAQAIILSDEVQRSSAAD